VEYIRGTPQIQKDPKTPFSIGGSIPSLTTTVRLSAAVRYFKENVP